MKRYVESGQVNPPKEPNYKGLFAVQNGYIFPPVHKSTEDCYAILFRDEEKGELLATQIIDTLPNIVIIEEAAKRVNVNARCINHVPYRWVITPRQYPPAFKGKCYDHIKRLAEAGNTSAVRFISTIVHMQLTRDGFSLEERNK